VLEWGGWRWRAAGPGDGGGRAPLHHSAAAISSPFSWLGCIFGCILFYWPLGPPNLRPNNVVFAMNLDRAEKSRGSSSAAEYVFRSDLIQAVLSVHSLLDYRVLQ
jgi:hypothetical protein